MHKDIKAVFDFDGTITTKDTLFHFIRFYHGSLKFWIGISILSPMLILFKCKLLSNEKAKQVMFSFFFANTDFDAFQSKCKRYANEVNKILNAEAKDKIVWHQKQGHEVLIVSASIENWIKPWAESMGINTVVGTRIEIEQNKLTGKFSTANCNGIEKTKRLLALYPNREGYKLYAYGDSKGDKEMLALADYPFFKTFND